jgi:hypothetical protein
LVRRISIAREAAELLVKLLVVDDDETMAALAAVPNDTFADDYNPTSRPFERPSRGRSSLASFERILPKTAGFMSVRRASIQLSCSTHCWRSSAGGRRHKQSVAAHPTGLAAADAAAAFVVVHFGHPLPFDKVVRREASLGGVLLLDV